MGCYDVTCCICGVTYYFENMSIYSENQIPLSEAKKIDAKLKWLRKITILSADNKIHNACRNVSCGNEFTCKSNIIFAEPIYNKLNILEDGNHGVLIHTDCWNFIKQNYNIKLKYCDLPLLYSLIKNNKQKNITTIYNTKIDMKDITKYYGQMFDFYKLFLDGKMDYAESPLKNNVNATRIKKVISQLKLKNQERPSPSISATFYPVNTIRIGNDGNFWKVNNGKWQKINETVITKKIMFDKKNNSNDIDYSKLSQIGEPSKIPIFISSFDKKSITILFNS